MKTKRPATISHFQMLVAEQSPRVTTKQPITSANFLRPAAERSPRLTTKQTDTGADFLRPAAERSPRLTTKQPDTNANFHRQVLEQPRKTTKLQDTIAKNRLPTKTHGSERKGMKSGLHGGMGGGQLSPSQPSDPLGMGWPTHRSNVRYRIGPENTWPRPGKFNNLNRGTQGMG